MRVASLPKVPGDARPSNVIIASAQMPPTISPGALRDPRTSPHDSLRDASAGATSASGLPLTSLKPRHAGDQSRGHTAKALAARARARGAAKEDNAMSGAPSSAGLRAEEGGGAPSSPGLRQRRMGSTPLGTATGPILP